MLEKHVVYKMFLAPKNADYDGFFCVFESKDSFFGYIIEKEKPDLGITMYLGKKNEKNLRYINCDHLVEFPKTTYYTRLITRYNLKELRDASEILHVGKAKQRILSGKSYEIKNYDTLTLEQRYYRKDQQLHQELRKAREAKERAIINNDREAEESAEKKIEQLNEKLGYRDTVSQDRYKLQLRDTVTNPKPLEGGLCTPK